jgi:Zn-dependent M28 family amino/carboxypeptidase
VLAALLLVAAALSAGCRGSGGTRFGLRAAARTSEQAAEETSASVPDELTTPSPMRFGVDPDATFDAGRAMADIRALAAFGPRGGGSDAERRAADYIARRLTEMGYSARTETFEIPGGRTSRNVEARLPGASSTRDIVLGAHFDTKPPSPGANDNASGVAVLLELARVLRQSPVAGEVVFVFYGTEEFLDVGNDSHHLGSRHHAAGMSEAELDDTAAMISVDMVGYGPEFKVRSMRRGPQTLVDHLLAEARGAGVGLGFEQDIGPTGWSDHEPYELRGVPVAWLQWQGDPEYHTAGDDAAHIQRRPVEITGAFLLRTLRGLDAAELERLSDR